MKRNFVFDDHRYINWFAKEGIDMPNQVWQAINEIEYSTRCAYDTDREEHTVISYSRNGDNLHTVTIASKYIEEDTGAVFYIRHKYSMRFTSSRIPQIDSLFFSWGHTETWGDTSLNDGSSPGDICIAFEIMKAINKYFNHSMW